MGRRPAGTSLVLRERAGRAEQLDPVLGRPGGELLGSNGRPRGGISSAAAGSETARTKPSKRAGAQKRIQHEALVRVLAADLGSDEDVVASLGALREDVAAKRELLAAARERAATLPHRERHLRVVHRLGDLLLDAEVEQELARP